MSPCPAFGSVLWPVSVLHKAALLSAYCFLEFCDDGFSGTDMDRPGMEKLLQEVKASKIRCIIVKDMSRFSRDYIEMGTYLNLLQADALRPAYTLMPSTAAANSTSTRFPG